MRIAIGCFMQESNSFSPVPTTLATFEAAGVHCGDDIVARFGGTNSELGGFLDVLRERGAAPAPLVAAHAISGGPLTREAYETLTGALLDRLQAALPVDGVLLALHGAMLAEGDDDPDGTTLEWVRAVVGPDVPVVATLDLHANVTARMVGAATALAGYNTYPHVDQAGTGRRGARLLLDALAGQPLASGWCKVPMIVPAENMQTTSGPMAEVYAKAHRLVAEGLAKDISVFGVQPWLDVPEMGCAAVAVTDGDALGVRRVADDLGRALWARRRAFQVALVPLGEALDRALSAPGHPVVLADSADGPGSGSPGDSTVILAALVERGLGQMAEDAGRPVLLPVVDPEAAAAAVAAGVGTTVQLAVGGKRDARWSRPVALTVRVAWVGDAVFTFKGPSFTGTQAHMGQTAVLAAGRLRVVATEHAVSTIDPELYRCVGLEPREAQVVVVKSPNMFRAAYGPLAHEILMVDTPGASSADLRALPFARLPRPLYPFDDFAWEPPAW